MTAQTESTKKVSTQVSATLSPELHARVEDYRWENRINKTSEVVAQAVEFFLNSKAPVTAAPEKPAK
jgi:hypothetical protein